MENKSIRFINRRGFTLIEVLFSLAICLLIVINVLPIVKIVTSKNNINVDVYKRQRLYIRMIKV